MWFMWEREIKPSLLFVPSLLKKINTTRMKGKKVQWNPGTVGRCPSFPAVIILHFIHIRALPRGTGMGNTDRACEVLLAMGRQNLKTGTLITACFFVHQYEAVNQMSYFFTRDRLNTLSGDFSQYVFRNVILVKCGELRPFSNMMQYKKHSITPWIIH